MDSLPELSAGFVESSREWVVANKTSTARPAGMQPYSGKYVLYADEYGINLPSCSSIVAVDEFVVYRFSYWRICVSGSFYR